MFDIRVVELGHEGVECGFTVPFSVTYLPFGSYSSELALPFALLSVDFSLPQVWSIDRVMMMYVK